MKVTVNKYLNARAEEASTIAECHFYKSPGDTIEIDDVLVGTEIDGNSIWYHCKDDGCFYWSGGIEEEEFQLEDKIVKEDNFIAVLGSIKNDKSFYFSKKVIGYKGVGIGYKNGNKDLAMSLVIFVDKKFTNEELGAQNILPGNIFYKGYNIQTDVKAVQRPITHEYDDNAVALDLTPDNRPIEMGGSISEKGKLGCGTRTIIVKKNNDPANYIMTCYHVLFFNTINTAEDFIFKKATSTQQVTAIFPSPNQNPTYPGKFNEHEVFEGELSGFYDYALVALNSAFEMENELNGVAVTEHVKREDIFGLIGKVIKTIGAVSYKQSGIVSEIKGEVTVDCNKVSRKYYDVIVADKISMPGDSGAPVVTTDNKLVGYIIGGNEIDVTYILPFYQLILNRDIVIKK